MSEPRANLFAALARAQQSAHAVEKDKKVTFGQQYKYASGESVIEEAKRALDGHGLAFLPTGYRVQTGEHGMMLAARYLLTHESGECLEIESETPIVPGQGRPEDKATATAKTYDLSYQLRGLLLLARVEEGAEPDARDDSAYEPKRSKPSAKEIQEEARAPKVDRAHVMKRIGELRTDLGDGEFSRIVGCSPAESEKWKPKTVKEASEKLASLEAALSARIESKGAA